MFHDEEKVNSIIARSPHCANFGSNGDGVHKGRACYYVTRSTQELQKSIFLLKYGNLVFVVYVDTFICRFTQFQNCPL